jgi:hypothetical protein
MKTPEAEGGHDSAGGSSRESFEMEEVYLV